MLTLSFPSFLLMLLAGIITLPPTFARLHSKMPFIAKKWVRIGIIVIAVSGAVNHLGIEIEPQMEQVRIQREEAKQVEQVVQQSYEIVYTLRGNRYDGGVSYFVLVSDIDLSSDSFKQEIKRMVDGIVKQKGRKISIDFVNDREILDLIYKSHYGENSLGRVLTKSEMESVGLHLVARFDGELDTALYTNSLDFFPSTFRDNPTVGTYVESIEYNPKK